MASHSGTDLVTAPLLMTILQYTLDPQLATNRPLHSRQIGSPFTIRHGLLKNKLFSYPQVQGFFTVPDRSYWLPFFCFS